MGAAQGAEALLGDTVVGPLDHIGMSCWGFLIHVSKTAYQTNLNLSHADMTVCVCDHACYGKGSEAQQESGASLTPRCLGP